MNLLNIDHVILDFIQTNFHNGFFDKVFVFITKLGDFGGIWVVLAIILLISKKYRKHGLTLVLALLFCSLLGDAILKPLFARLRPFEFNDNIMLLIPKPNGYSFPSGHTMSSFAAATVLLYTNRKYGIIALIFAALIAFSRLYLYVHYPSDILAGMIIGILLGWLAIKIMFPNKGQKVLLEKLFKKN